LIRNRRRLPGQKRIHISWWCDFAHPTPRPRTKARNRKQSQDHQRCSWKIHAIPQHGGVDPNLRCAAIRSRVVLRAKRNQLGKVFQPLTRNRKVFRRVVRYPDDFQLFWKFLRNISR
jgi:hypothetical protein